MSAADDPRAAGAEPVDFDKCPVCHQDTSHIPLEIAARTAGYFRGCGLGPVRRWPY